MENKARLTTYENIALFEYQPVEKPFFEIDKDGVLFIFGYKTAGISSAKRHETNLKGFTALGKFNEIKPILKGDIDKVEKMVEQANIDTNNCLILIKE